MEHDGTTLEYIEPQPQAAAGDPDRSTRRAVALPQDTVSITIDLGSGGRRSVELPADQVEGRTVEELFGLALRAMDTGSDYAAGVFSDHAARRYARAEASVEMRLEDGPCSPTTRDTRVQLGQHRTLYYRLGMDHIGG